MSYNPSPQRSEQVTLTTGNSATISNGTTLYIINSSIALLAATITLPSAPTDGMPLTIESPKGISTLTLTPNSGQTISGPTISIATANIPIRLKYSNINSTWYPN